MTAERHAQGSRGAVMNGGEIATQVVTVGDALGAIAWVIGIAIIMIGGLASIIITLLIRNADRSERRRDGQGRDAARGIERTQERTVENAIDFSAMQANVNMLLGDRNKCDELDREVAVLKDFKQRAEQKFDEVDDVTRAQERFGEQMRTVFKRLDGIDEKIDRVPQETAEKLRTMIRPVQRAANG